MMPRRDTLAERVARAQKEMASWDSRYVAAMQLQGAKVSPGSNHHHDMSVRTENNDRVSTNDVGGEIADA